MVTSLSNKLANNMHKATLSSALGQRLSCGFKVLTIEKA